MRVGVGEGTGVGADGAGAVALAVGGAGLAAAEDGTADDALGAADSVAEGRVDVPSVGGAVAGVVVGVAGTGVQMGRRELRASSRS